MAAEQLPIIVVGAGLAGLNCARRLCRRGVPVIVFEEADAMGGRVHTDITADGIEMWEQSVEVGDDPMVCPEVPQEAQACTQNVYVWHMYCALTFICPTIPKRASTLPNM